MKKTLLTLAMVGMTAVASHAQGTIQFSNTGASVIKYQDVLGGPVVNAPDGCVIGLFWGADANSLTLQTPTTLTKTVGTTSGLYDGGAVYPLTGSQPGQFITFKIAGWRGGTANDHRDATHYGESAVVTLTTASAGAGLGPTAGPGTVIIQGATGTNPNRTKAFTITPVPEPSVMALGALGLGALLLRRRKA